ncbi:MAG: endonuclease Q family protein [Candidatus Magasanikbacteria bacterium]|nr:endonuclease Q family protein [Candidatus Magasanikbacteria bacterium]
MQQIADFHIHSRFSRACSRDLTIPNIEAMCRVKGIDIIGTGDFTYPDWFREIKENLVEVNNSGLFKLKTSSDEKVLLTLTSEVALIYKKYDKCRRIHIVIHAPSLEAVEELNADLDADYNIRSDGRPILGMSVEELMEKCLAIDSRFLIYPAHIWTPWFAVFGSKSGFDSLSECFGEYTNQIFACETGLSSDPEMNWRLSGLDKITLLSSSDAHSLSNLAREATVFDLTERTYDEIYQAIKNKDTKKIKYTIEFYPEEGMYHYDGHRDCGVRLTPAETKKLKGLCPKCGRPVVVGVENRVEELADRPLGYKSKKFPGSKKLVGLEKIIAEALNVKSPKAKKVKIEYDKLINKLGSELSILLDVSILKIEKMAGEKIAEGVRRVRAGELKIEPGYDGGYGKVRIFT